MQPAHLHLPDTMQPEHLPGHLHLPDTMQPSHLLYELHVRTDLCEHLWGDLWKYMQVH